MPHVTFAPLAILAIASAAMTTPTLAQTTVRNERVQFPRGATSTSVRGTIRGYQVVDYVVGARAGQALAVSLRTDNASTYCDREASSIFAQHRHIRGLPREPACLAGWF